MLLTNIKNWSRGQMLWVAGESNKLHWLRSRTDSTKRLRQTEVKQPTAPLKIQVGGQRGNSDVQWRQETASRAPTINTSFATKGKLLWPRVESVTYVTHVSTNVKLEWEYGNKRKYISNYMVRRFKNMHNMLHYHLY